MSTTVDSWCLQKFVACDKLPMIQTLRRSVLDKHLLTSDAINIVSDVSLAGFDRGKTLHDSKFRQELLNSIVRMLPPQRPIIIHSPCRWICSTLKLLQHAQFKFVILTFGRDNKGSPVLGCDTRNQTFHAANRDCFQELLSLHQTHLYFVSQHKSKKVHPKLRFVPIGFGELRCHTSYGVPEVILRQAYEFSYNYLDVVCDQNLSVHSEKFFVNHGLGFSHHARIRNESLTAMNSLGANGTKYGKLSRNRLLMSAMNSVVGSSPRGTGADCHRHMELLMSGLIVLANMDEARVSLEMYSDLPIKFIDTWKNITCDNVTQFVQEMYDHQDRGESFMYQKLTAEYWQQYIMQEVCRVANIVNRSKCLSLFGSLKMEKCI